MLSSILSPPRNLEKTFTVILMTAKVLPTNCFRGIRLISVQWDNNSLWITLYAVCLPINIYVYISVCSNHCLLYYLKLLIHRLVCMHNALHFVGVLQI